MEKSNRLNKKSPTQWLLNYALYVVLGLMIIFVVIRQPTFLFQHTFPFINFTNILNILTQASTRGIMALGVAGLIVLQGTDLSAGRIVGICGIVAASLLQAIDYSTRMYENLPWDNAPTIIVLLIPLVISILIGLVFGAINGFGVAVLKLHAFIITLGTQLIAYGISCMYIESSRWGAQPLGGLDNRYTSLVRSGIYINNIAIVIIAIAAVALLGFMVFGYIRNKNNASSAEQSKIIRQKFMKNLALYLIGVLLILGIYLSNERIPLLVIYTAVFAIIIWFIWNKTKLGKNMFAIGGNTEAAAVSGVNIVRNIMYIFLISGALYGVAGYLEAARIGSATSNLGLNYELDAIAACVVGGVSFNGGVGTIPGVIIGVIILQFINYGLVFINVNPYLQYVIKGLIIIFAVALDVRKYLTRK